MKHHQFLSCIVFVLSIFSCSEKKKEYVLKVELNYLTEKTMYDGNMVEDVIFDAHELDIDSLRMLSQEIFLKGLDEYKNKNNPSKATLLFKSSILTFPSAKAYYELGNAFLDLNDDVFLEESIKAYDIAKHLQMQPVSNIYYKQAIASNILYSRAKSKQNKQNAQDEEYLGRVIYYLRMAINNGFVDTLNIKNDPRIHSITTTTSYKALLADMQLNNKDQSSNNLFEIYKNAYPVIKEDFEISSMEVGMDYLKESISYDFSSFVPEMQNVSFGRDVSNDFLYVANIKETSTYNALIYSSVSFWGESSMQPVYTMLVTYDKAGSILDRKLISCQCSAEKIKTVKITDATIQIEDYKRTWSQPITEVSFDENTIKSYDLLAKATYTINDEGKIIASDIPSDYNDSSVVVSIKNTPR